MFRFLFKIPAHRTFDHTPIYYNPEKEDLKRRVEGIEEDGKQHASKLAQGSLKESWGRSTRIAQGNRTSAVRLVIIILILVLFSWLLLFY